MAGRKPTSMVDKTGAKPAIDTSNRRQNHLNMRKPHPATLYARAYDHLNIDTENTARPNGADTTGPTHTLVTVACTLV
jgi:hypothetical protein